MATWRVRGSSRSLSRTASRPWPSGRVEASLVMRGVSFRCGLCGLLVAGGAVVFGSFGGRGFEAAACFLVGVLEPGGDRAVAGEDDAGVGGPRAQRRGAAAELLAAPHAVP